MNVLTIVSCIFAMLSVMGVIWARSLAELWTKNSTEYTSTSITILCALQLGLLAILFVVDHTAVTVGIYAILAMSAGLGLVWTRNLHIAWDEDKITRRFVPMFGVQLAATCCVLYGQLLWNY